jgi:hypothetical protein
MAMPVKFKKAVTPETKTKATTTKPTKKQIALSAMGDLVDPMYEKMTEAKTLRSKLSAVEKELKPMKTEFLDHFATVHPDVDFEGVVTGKDHEVNVSKATKSRKLVSVEAAYDELEAVKDGLFTELAKVNIGDLEKYLTPDALAKVLETIEDPKNRSITAVTES